MADKVNYFLMYTSGIPQHDYMGLPRFTPEERDVLGHAIDYDMEDQRGGWLGIHDVGSLVISSNFSISHIVIEDRRHYLEHETENVDTEVAEIFADSIRQGYEFFIGCMTWVRFFRSGGTDMFAFLDSAQPGVEVPLVGAQELERIIAVRTGEAVVDALKGDERDITSKRLAGSHICDYVLESPNFSSLLDYYYNQLTDNATPAEEARAAGIFHGIACSLEMYIQSHEEQLFQAYRLGTEEP